MCGATPQETEISDAQQQFYTTLSNEYTQIFGQSQGITSALTSAFLPILQAGPSQTGFSPSEENALRTQNTQNVATDYAQAQKATASILAARGGGNTMLPSSVTSNILASNTNAAAATRAQGENSITQANYAQGYQNWNTAANVLGSTAGLLNPNAYSSSATTAGGAASKTADQIAQANFAPWGAFTGAAGSILGSAVGKGGIWGK
jgi:Tol biopolymer transport system component